MAALALMAPLGLSAQAQPAGPIGLQCRLEAAGWQPCRMVISSDGLQWRLEVAQQAFLFRHDGRGAVSMRSGNTPWLPVQALWRADASLCWNGICAKGPIPLD